MNHRQRLAAVTLALLVPTVATGVSGCSFSTGASSAGSSSATSAPPQPGRDAATAPSTTPTRPTTPAGGSASASPTGVSTCRADQLEPFLGADPADPEEALLLSVVNHGPGSCVLHCYPGLAFTTQDGHMIGAAATRIAADDEPTFTLEAGTYAHATVRVKDPSSYPASTCQPVDAPTLSVYPPNQEGISGPIPAEQQACSSTAAPQLAVGPLLPSGSQH